MGLIAGRPRELLAAVPPVALMIVWAAAAGGYSPGVWYWGALVLLAVAAVLAVSGRLRCSRPAAAAIGALALYTAWSYLSIAWSSAPGTALEGSNRTLLYLLLFSIVAVLPWTPRAAFAVLLVWVAAIGVIELVLLLDFATASHLTGIILDHRLASPTGYYNATAALLTIQALLATSLATRSELPAVARGLLLALACGAGQLALIAESRGWLFTLPLVLLAGIAVTRDRLAATAAAALVIAGILAPVHRLLDIFSQDFGPGLDQASRSAGHAALLSCAAVFFLATLAFMLLRVVPVKAPGPRARQRIGALVAVLAVLAGAGGAAAATHGHPWRFVQRQWRGFSHPATSSTDASHFAAVGSGRYDFWRVGLDAFAGSPVGGLGQDNFGDYYIRRRHTAEEPQWTHSLEIRLLAHTGVVGFLLFSAFLGLALTAALRAVRRAPGLGGALAGAALLPVIVWTVHGSLDWFWEVPALSGPALGFLALAGALAGPLSAPEASPAVPAAPRRRFRRSVTAAATAAGVVAGTVVLGFPFLSIREEDRAQSVRSSDPARALDLLRTAARLNPLAPDPARVAGTVALVGGRYQLAEERFREAIDREPGGWFAWFGDGLAASALGDLPRARRDFLIARGINDQQPVIRTALTRAPSTNPLSVRDALRMITLSQ